MKKYFLPIFIFIFGVIGLLAEETTVIHEEFHSLDNWKTFYFQKIKRHTKYNIEKDGENTFLRAESDASASALIYQKEFNVYEYPRAKWRWKVKNIYKGALPGTKDGDDYPIRVYIIFKYDPARLGIFEKIKYQALRVLYGEYPPDSSLSYVWASSADNPRVLPSPYTDRARLIALERGPDRIGEWIEESVNILEDYRKAFGKDPPLQASIAIMNDSDNTGQSSVSYVGNLSVYR
jgi:hypothetical protein